MSSCRVGELHPLWSTAYVCTFAYVFFSLQWWSVIRTSVCGSGGLWALCQLLCPLSENRKRKWPGITKNMPRLFIERNSPKRNNETECIITYADTRVRTHIWWSGQRKWVLSCGGDFIFLCVIKLFIPLDLNSLLSLEDIHEHTFLSDQLFSPSEFPTVALFVMYEDISTDLASCISCFFWWCVPQWASTSGSTFVVSVCLRVCQPNVG